MRDVQLDPKRCQQLIYWRGGRYQCDHGIVYGDKCRRHGIPPGKPFKVWRVGRYNDPSEHEFIAETGQWFIAANGDRVKKVSKSGRFFATKIEALAHELERAKKSVESANRHAAYAASELKKAQAAYAKELEKVSE